MKSCLKIIPFEEMDEKIFFDFLNRDPILHIFTIYDLKYMRDKTKVWVALKNGEIHGYIFEFDNRIVHTHGTVESIAKLLDCIDLDEVIFVIEPHHLAVVEKAFEPVVFLRKYLYLQGTLSPLQCFVLKLHGTIFFS